MNLQFVLAAPWSYAFLAGAIASVGLIVAFVARKYGEWKARKDVRTLLAEVRQLQATSERISRRTGDRDRLTATIAGGGLTAENVGEMIEIFRRVEGASRVALADATTAYKRTLPEALLGEIAGDKNSDGDGSGDANSGNNAPGKPISEKAIKKWLGRNYNAEDVVPAITKNGVKQSVNDLVPAVGAFVARVEIPGNDLNRMDTATRRQLIEALRRA